MRLDSAEQAERFLKWLAGKQHLVRSLHLEQGDGAVAGAGGEEEEEGEGRPKAQSELPRHVLFVLGMLAGGPLTNLSWSIRGSMGVRSWMFACLPALQRLSLRCLDDAPGTIALGRDLSRLTSLTGMQLWGAPRQLACACLQAGSAFTPGFLHTLRWMLRALRHKIVDRSAPAPQPSRLTPQPVLGPLPAELVVAHGATDASLEGVVFPTSLRSLGLSPVTAELPEAVAAATHLRQLSISNVDMLVRQPAAFLGPLQAVPAGTHARPSLPCITHIITCLQQPCPQILALRCCAGG